MKLDMWKVRRAVAGLIVVVAVSGTGGPAPRGAAAQSQAAAQDEFVPLDELPVDEQMPAAPLVMVAYAVAWLIVLAYLWSIWRRLGHVEREIAGIGRRVAADAPREPTAHGGGGGGPAAPKPQPGG